LCCIGRGTHIRGTQHDNKLQHGHTQQDMNGTVITCVHTCHLWDSHVFTLFVCGMQRIHKHKKVGCALTENLVRCTPAIPSEVCGPWLLGDSHGLPAHNTILSVPALHPKPISSCSCSADGPQIMRPPSVKPSRAWRQHGTCTLPSQNCTGHFVCGGPCTTHDCWRFRSYGSADTSEASCNFLLHPP